MNGQSSLSTYRLLAILAVAFCLLSLAEGVIPQLQMQLLGGRMLIGNVLAKIALLVTLACGLALHPKFSYAGIPIYSWKICCSFLVLEIGYLLLECNTPLSELLLSYNSYYLLLLVGPAALAFRGAVSERLVVRCTVSLFLLCAAIGIAQHLTAKPLLYTESVNGSFVIQSWQFFDEVRAFSLFTSGLSFGIFCSLCGALGVALARKSPLPGTSLAVLSALACYATLTRLCYLIFFCACTYSAIISFGKKSSRGLWQPLIYFGLGIATILLGVKSFNGDAASQLGSASSLLDRVIEWTYYYDLLANSSPLHQLLGLGIVQHDRITQTRPAVDNVFFALALHIGIVGVVLFSALMTKMWLYLRREALASQQPFVVAAASLWATFACAGTFNIIFAAFGAIFALAILCGNGESHVNGSNARTT